MSPNPILGIVSVNTANAATGESPAHNFFLTKERFQMKPITWLGVLLVIAGILGLAIPVFTTSQTKDVVNMGDLKIQNTEHSTHVVPEALSAGVLVLGAVLIGAGLYRKD
jgi:uncharacterized membrane protein HdeD (DUF308 family)